MHKEFQQAAEASILNPIETSMSDADPAASKSESAESAGTPGSGGNSGAGRGTALLGSDLVARVGELAHKCSETKASIKQMHAR